MKLKYLKLNTLIDAAFQCGMDGRPVFIFISAPPGSGKTWASQSLTGKPNIEYYTAAFSPNEYLKHIAKIAPATKLFIHDDLGLCSQWNIDPFNSAWMMMINGKITYKHFKQPLTIPCNFSVILLSTFDFFGMWYDKMKGSGLLDRMVIVQLNLSDETRTNYQFNAQICAEEHLDNRKDAPVREIHLRPKHEPMNLLDKNINPRSLKNLLKLSTYLIEDEMNELIGIVKSETPDYEI